MFHKTWSPPSHHRQHGAVLFVALVFLVLLTLLGLTAASTSVLQERMTGGLRNAQLGLMGAESSVRGVEALIWNKSNNPASNKLHCGPTGGSDTCYSISNITGVSVMNSKVATFRTLKGWPSSTTGDGAAAAATSLTGLSGSQATASLAQQPRYLIENLGIVLKPGAPPNGSGGARLPTDTGGAGNQTLHAFRITSRATGGNTGSVRATESYFVALPPSF